MAVPSETLILFFCKDTPNIVTNSDDRQLSKEFLIAAKAIDLVGNPVREIGYIAFVAAYIEGIEG